MEKHVFAVHPNYRRTVAISNGVVLLVVLLGTVVAVLWG